MDGLRSDIHVHLGTFKFKNPNNDEKHNLTEPATKNTVVQNSHLRNQKQEVEIVNSDYIKQPTLQTKKTIAVYISLNLNI